MEQMTEILGFTPRMPEPKELDPSGVIARYHGDSDTLYVHFFGLRQPAVSIDLNPYLYVRVSRESHLIVGIQIEGYLTHAVRDEPRWLDWAEIAGIPLERVEAIRQEISFEKKRESALHTTLEEILIASQRSVA